MKKSKVQLVNLLKEKLLEFPNIVNKLERKELDFMHHLISWIKASEDIFSTHNISDISELSGLRSKIIATRYSDNKNFSTKKIELKVASEVLFDLQHVVFRVLTPLENNIEECREMIRQLLLIVSQAQIIKYNKNLPFENLINEIWQFITNNEQLKPGAVKLRTSLTLTDIQMLIADEINLQDFS